MILFYHPQFTEQAKFSKDKYDLVDFVFPGMDRFARRNLKGYSSRTCRFCGRSYPDTAFANDSHLLPKLIGNTNLYSEFECDDCNAFISKFENDLASYLGVSRSIVGLQGEKKTKGFDARRLKAKSRSFLGDNILIIAPEDVKTEGDATSISYTKNTFVPARAYKALLKSALSILSEAEVKQKYRKAIDYLQGKINLTKGAIIGGYRFPFSMNLPLHVLCFRRKELDNNSVPEYMGRQKLFVSDT